MRDRSPSKLVPLVLGGAWLFLASGCAGASKSADRSTCQTFQRNYRSGMNKVRARFPNLAAASCDPLWRVVKADELDRSGVATSGEGLNRLLPYTNGSR